jgi:RHS repeat-associated protein
LRRLLVIGLMNFSRLALLARVVAAAWLSLAQPIFASHQATLYPNTAGRLTSRTDFNGKTTTFAYHSQNDWLMQKSADATHPSLILPHAPKTIRYDYDVIGRRTLAEVKNNLGTVLHTQSWAYDTRDRITATDTPLASLAYTYDASSSLTSTTSSTTEGYAMSYEHDVLGRMSSALDHNNLDTSANPARTSYAYTDVGTLSSVTLPNTLKHFYNYNERHQLISSGIANATSQTVLGYAYTLNASGRRTQVNEFTGDASPTRTINFLYDALHRLTQESGAGVSPALAGTVNYTLDAVGNRTARTSTLNGVTNQTQSVDANDRLITDTTDNNGNTLASSLNGSTVADIYDFEDKLIRRVESTGKVIDVLYDADGNRVAKTVAGLQPASSKTTRYLIDTNNPTGYAQVIEEHESTSASVLSTLNLQLSTVYSYGLDLISQDRRANSTAAWQLSYYLYDGGGHVRALSNIASALTDSYTYDAFGVLIASTGTTTNNYLYRGEQFDHDLGLYYQRARYLNAETGRFWTQDSYEGSPGTPASLHKYLYANGDPVGGWDPGGHIGILDALGAITLNGALRTMVMVQTSVRIATAARFAVGTLQALTVIGLTVSEQFRQDYVNTAMATGMNPIAMAEETVAGSFALAYGASKSLSYATGIFGARSALASVEPFFARAAFRLQELYPDAMMLLRGSTVNGIKGPHKLHEPFDPTNFDVDGLIVSDELAKLVPKTGAGRRWVGNRAPQEVQAIQAEVQAALQRIPGYDTSKSGSFIILTPAEYAKEAMDVWRVGKPVTPSN